jgi:hypothetical protein
MSVFGSLGRRIMPRIWARLDAENMHETMYCTEWFMTVFTRSFHFDFVTRVWDVFLAEGRKVLYRAALALVKVRPMHCAYTCMYAFSEIMIFCFLYL